MYIYQLLVPLCFVEFNLNKDKVELTLPNVLTFFYSILQILNIGLFGLAINIRYDSIFGNIEIQDLLSQIKSENISIKSTTEYFSIVAVTFSIISILASLYSTIIVTVKVYEKWRYPLTISVSIRINEHTEEGSIQSNMQKIPKKVKV